VRTIHAKVLPKPDRNGWVLLVYSAFLAAAFVGAALRGDAVAVALSGVPLCVLAASVRLGDR
jgi:hypothetical protein